MNARVFTAILCGCIVGGMLVYLLAEQSGWYFLGVPIGGIAAWLSYAWRDIRREAPAVWASVSGWRPNTERWRAVGAYFLWTVILSAAFSLNLLLIILALMMWYGHDLLFSLRIATFPTVLFFVFTSIFAHSFSGLEDREKRPSLSRIRVVTRGQRALVLWWSPIGVVYLLGLGVLRLPRALPILGTFLVRLFVLVHSNDALDCFIYAATGVLIGTLVTQTIWVVVISSFVGVGLALVFRQLAKLIRILWPQYA